LSRFGVSPRRPETCSPCPTAVCCRGRREVTGVEDARLELGVDSKPPIIRY
jgi:hypothetical protein